MKSYDANYHYVLLMFMSGIQNYTAFHKRHGCVPITHNTSYNESFSIQYFYLNL